MSAQREGDNPPASSLSERELGVVLICFGGEKAAAKARKPLETTLRSNGDAVLETTILQVNGKQKASLYDPHRVLAGALTASFTWGLFGLVAGTNRLESAIIWAVIGAICGGIYAYTTEHVLTKSELKRIADRMPPNSSALLTFAETSDPERALASSSAYTPSTASLAVIDAELIPRVFAGSDSPVELPLGSTAAPDETSPVNMLLYRYPDRKTAARLIAGVSTGKPAENGAPQVELVIETDTKGHRHVSDPTRGTAAWAKAATISWALFGLVFGALAGAIGGGGLHGLVSGALATGIGWGIFGLGAGALYGLWAGRSISARRLKGIGPLLGRGTSALVAWADGPPRQSAIELFATPGSKRLVLSFNPIAGGAILEAE